ncbi:hypothetical protein FBU30_004112, partial [Linnemannia zychae]
MQQNTYNPSKEASTMQQNLELTTTIQSSTAPIMSTQMRSLSSASESDPLSSASESDLPSSKTLRKS